jgi:hypothetical protein
MAEEFAGQFAADRVRGEPEYPRQRLAVQVHESWPRGPYVQTRASVALALCTRRHGQSWHGWETGRNAEERRKVFLSAALRRAW